MNPVILPLAVILAAAAIVCIYKLFIDPFGWLKPYDMAVSVATPEGFEYDLFAQRKGRFEPDLAKEFFAGHSRAVGGYHDLVELMRRGCIEYLPTDCKVLAIEPSKDGTATVWVLVIKASIGYLLNSSKMYDLGECLILTKKLASDSARSESGPANREPALQS